MVYNIIVFKSCKQLKTWRYFMNKLKQTTYREMRFIYDPIWERFDYVSIARHQMIESMYVLNVFSVDSSDYQIMINASI